MTGVWGCGRGRCAAVAQRLRAGAVGPGVRVAHGDCALHGPTSGALCFLPLWLCPHRNTERPCTVCPSRDSFRSPNSSTAYGVRLRPCICTCWTMETHPARCWGAQRACGRLTLLEGAEGPAAVAWWRWAVHARQLCISSSRHLPVAPMSCASGLWTSDRACVVVAASDEYWACAPTRCAAAHAHLEANSIIGEGACIVA